MPEKDVAEVLQWINLVMGNDMEGETPIDLMSIVSRLHQLKSESDFNKNESNRYKKELEQVKQESGDLKSKLETTISRLTKELESSKVEAKRYKAQMETGLKMFDETLSAEKTKVSQLMKELEISRGETERCKAHMRVFDEKLAAESTKVSQLKKDLESARDETERCKAECESELSSLRESVSAEIVTVTAELQIRENETKLCKTTIATLTELIKTKSHQIKQMKAEIQKVQAGSSNNQTDKSKVAVKKSQGALLGGLSLSPRGTTIHAIFTNVSALTTLAVPCQAIRIDGMNWSIQVLKRDEHLEIRLNVHNNRPKWECSALFEVELISHLPEGITKCTGTKNELFDKHYANWTSDKFISTLDLFDEANGFVKDDSIVVRAVIKPLPYCLNRP